MKYGSVGLISASLKCLLTKNPSIRRVFIVAGAGFEPATSGL